jgi:hypothetical protein
MGYSVFALRATQNVQTCRQHDSILLGKARRLPFPGLKPWAVFRTSFGRLEYAQKMSKPQRHFVPGYDQPVPPGQNDPVSDRRCPSGNFSPFSSTHWLKPTGQQSAGHKTDPGVAAKFVAETGKAIRPSKRHTIILALMRFTWVLPGLKR